MPPNWDIINFWNKVEEKNYTHLGGEEGRYSVSFSGPIEIGLNILGLLLEAEEYEILLKSFKGGDMDVQEKKEETSSSSV